MLNTLPLSLDNTTDLTFGHAITTRRNRAESTKTPQNRLALLVAGERFRAHGVSIGDGGRKLIHDDRGDEGGEIDGIEFALGGGAVAADILLDLALLASLLRLLWLGIFLLGILVLWDTEGRDLVEDGAVVGGVVVAVFAVVAGGVELAGKLFADEFAPGSLGGAELHAVVEAGFAVVAVGAALGHSG